MGDLSVEPSMEDILSSIKRIIAEEGDPAPIRARRAARPAARPVEVDGEDEEAEEVLELNDPMPQPSRQAAPRAIEPAPRAIEPAPRAVEPAPRAAEAPTAAESPTPEPATPEPIVSHHTAAATRGSLEALSRLMVKPEPASDGTLEGLVRDMLRPMLKEWLDANLPAVVETMVEREIAKITATR